MFPADRRSRAVALLAAVVLAAVLPTSVMAAAPTAVPDSFTVSVGSGVTGLPVLANDIGDGLTIAFVTDPPDGTATIAGGHLNYMPDPAFYGIETFQYTIEDETSATSSATVTVTVNDPPIAVDDPGVACEPTTDWGGSFPIPEDYVGTVEPTDYFVLFGPCSLLDNDRDPNGDTLDYVFVDLPEHGDVTYIAPDFFSYRPDPNFSTRPGDQPGGQWISDSFTYQAFDGLSYSAPATMKFWIAPINDAPTFTPGANVVVAEDSGPYDAAWATHVSPGPNESGQTVHFELDGPAAITGTPGLFVGLPVISATGVLSFTPAPNASGLAHLTFVAKDDGGLENYIGVTPSPPADDTSDQFTFDIAITATNDSPIAAADSLTVAEDAVATSVPVLANDTDADGDARTITAKTNGAKGVVAITGGGTGLTYRPNANANGSDSFTYTISDGHGGSAVGSVSVTTTPVNDLPMAANDSVSVSRNAGASAVNVLGNDADPDADPLTITAKTNGTKGIVVITGGGTGLTYQPNASAIGPDSFTYTISDGHTGSSTATVSVSIAQGAVPAAVADITALAEDSPATAVPVLANDTDADADTLTITARTNGTKGVVTLTSPTTLTYKPNLNANGPDTFTYTISDGHGGVAVGTVNVTITPVNDAPNAANDAGLTVPESAGVWALPVLANDTDADGDGRTITAKTNGAHGAVAITGGGTGLTYDPNQLYFGTDVFTYTISDGHGGSDTATVLLTVVRDTAKPIATAPAQRFLGQTVGTGSAKVRLSWTGTDAAGTGIAKYQLQASVNGGAYSTVALPSATATSVDRTLTDGRSYRYRVRATDREGNVGAFVYGPTFTSARIQNSSAQVTYAGSWSTTSNASASGGTHRYASSTSARASITRTAWDIAWVATKTPTSGSAQVWIDGVLAATVNLKSSSNTFRQLVFQRHFSTLSSHRLEIRPIGGGRVYLDAFLIAR